MRNFFSKLSSSKAALIVGVAFITSVINVTIVDDFLLSNFVIPGDTSALANDIEANRLLFHWAAVGYFIVLLLDSIIGLALYVVLRPVNQKLALITALLRVWYALILIIGVWALTFQAIDIFDYSSIKLVGYVFFAFHILVLGYTVIRSGYIPKSLGVLLIIASFTYVLFYIDIDLPGSIEVGTMLIMAVAEFALSVWLIVKRNSLAKIEISKKNYSEKSRRR